MTLNTARGTHATGRRPLAGLRLAGAEGDADGAVGGGAAGLRGGAKDVAAPGDLEIGEAGVADCLFELSFQESTGNSTDPQVDLQACRVG
jgi:hypothetical protein